MFQAFFIEFLKLLIAFFSKLFLLELLVLVHLGYQYANAFLSLFHCFTDHSC